MRIPRKAARRAADWLRRRVRRPREAHGLILMYHRVAQAAVDPWQLCVSPENFESQVRALRESFDLVPLVRLPGQLRQGRKSRPVAAITFDDGYLDNLTVAKPILQRHGVPATVFVITGFLGRAEAFWWDRLANVVLRAETLPRHIELASESSRFVWEDPALAQPGPHRSTARRRLHDRLWVWLAGLYEPGRSQALGQLEQCCEASPAVDSFGRPLTADELRELASGGLIDVGAHTVSHPMLSQLSSPAKASEIRSSRDDCRRILGRAPECFSYPNGDYDAESVELVRSAGFTIACTSTQDLHWAAGDRHSMPRISVKNVPGTSLVRRLGWEWLA